MQILNLLHLNVFSCFQVSEFSAIMFSYGVEDYSSSWHIHSHSKSLRGKQHLCNIRTHYLP